MSGTDSAFRSFYGNRSVQVDVLHRVCPNLLYGTNHENGQTLTVPAECFYVLGDNTEHSYDSRCWKEPFVERQDVLAVVIIP